MSVKVTTKMLAKPQDCKGSGNATALDGSPLPDVVEYIKDGKVDLVINIPEVSTAMPPFLDEKHVSRCEMLARRSASDSVDASVHDELQSKSLELSSAETRSNVSDGGKVQSRRATCGTCFGKGENIPFQCGKICTI